LSESEFYTPDDPDLLRMENELLTFEVRFLRARLGYSGSGPGSSSTSLNQLARLEEAERDLVLLLRRMSRGAPGRVLRLKREFRTLEERYLRSPVLGDPASPNRLAYLEQAEKDLVLLLRRMGTSPLGRIFRTKPEFRTLEQRYL
jgi:hypothetical protein